jgi:hypothetical protein
MKQKPSLAAVAAVAALALSAAPSLVLAEATPMPYKQLPAGGKTKDCHGYVVSVSSNNLTVHCIDGTPIDLSFAHFPDEVDEKDGKTMKTADLKEKTAVHVLYTQSFGSHKAYQIMLADPNATGPYGFKDQN